MSTQSNFSEEQQKQAIADMLSMQNTLNEMTNGVHWRDGMTQSGKPIDWQRCIYMETAELIDSYPWKHWKSIDAAIDIENARVELVDIWHFLLSLVLEKNASESALILLNEALLQSQKENSEITSQSTIVEQVSVYENLMREALKQECDLAALADAFFQSCQVADLSFVKLHEVYMAKNVLNKFRQDHGYKEGTYIKEWFGKEDNVVMFEVIAELNVFDSDSLYNALENRYEMVTKID